MRRAADRAVDMRIEEDAMFMLAESYYFDDRCIQARDAYNELADKYPEHALPRQARGPRVGDRPLSGSVRECTLRRGR